MLSKNKAHWPLPEYSGIQDTILGFKLKIKQPGNHGSYILKIDPMKHFTGLNTCSIGDKPGFYFLKIRKIPMSTSPYVGQVRNRLQRLT